MPPGPEHWLSTIQDMLDRSAGNWDLMAQMIEGEFGVRVDPGELCKSGRLNLARTLWREIEKTEPNF